MSKPINQELRLEVFKRDNYTCRYCGSKKGPFHCDHVYPRSKGGETTIRNLVTACRSCNLRKHARVGVWPNAPEYNQKINELVQANKRMSRPFPFWFEFAGGIALAVVSVAYLYPQYFNGYLVAFAYVVLLLSLVSELIWKIK